MPAHGLFSGEVSRSSGAGAKKFGSGLLLPGARSRFLAASATAAAALLAASPVLAEDDRRRRGQGPSAGEVVAGALLIGGAAALIAAGASDRRHRGWDDDRGPGWDDRGWDEGGWDDRDWGNPRWEGRGPRQARLAIDRCARTAEIQAQRASGLRADVLEVRDVDPLRQGFRVRGRIAVSDGWNARGAGHRGWRQGGWDEGRFTCDVRHGQVVGLRYHGLHGL